jgi:ABC-type branched-subunit amino acid transport system substrate-binding protein
MADFYKYFKENMDGLGLPAPETLFGTLQAATGNAVVLLTQIDKFGKAVTIADLIGAGTRLEALATIGACSAAFYVGAVIGSIAVATGRSLAGGTSIADVLALANRYNLNRPWLHTTLARYPGIYDKKVASRNTYRNSATV